jgi:hypothetical protein
MDDTEGGGNAKRRLHCVVNEESEGEVVWADGWQPIQLKDLVEKGESLGKTLELKDYLSPSWPFFEDPLMTCPKLSEPCYKVSTVKYCNKEVPLSADVLSNIRLPVVSKFDCIATKELPNDIHVYVNAEDQRSLGCYKPEAEISIHIGNPTANPKSLAECEALQLTLPVKINGPERNWNPAIALESIYFFDNQKKCQLADNTAKGGKEGGKQFLPRLCSITCLRTRKWLSLFVRHMRGPIR